MTWTMMCADAPLWAHLAGSCSGPATPAQFLLTVATVLAGLALLVGAAKVAERLVVTGRGREVPPLAGGLLCGLAAAGAILSILLL